MMIKELRMAAENDISQISNWIGGFLASLPIIGFWYKTRQDLRKEILESVNKASAAHARAEELFAELMEYRLDVEKNFVTKTSLDKVAADIKEDAKEREQRVTDILRGIHKRFDNHFGANREH